MGPGSLVGSGGQGELTFTSQMLMPPSMPVVQNCEHLALPPLSTEIWLQRGGGLYGWNPACSCAGLQTTVPSRRQEYRTGLMSLL